MKNFLIAASVIVGLAGCGKSGSDPAAKFKGFADQMCACKKDKDPKGCATKVMVEENKWENTLDEKSINEAMEDKMETSEKAMDACREEIDGE